MPAATPPLRAPPKAAAQRRLEWIELAIAGEPGLIADSREVRRPGPSYTVDTLLTLRAEHPRAPLCLLLGADAAQRLPEWHRWEELPELAHLVFFDRPGAPTALAPAVALLLRERAARDARALHERAAGLWLRAEIPALNISASDVRRRLQQGRSVRGLVPDRVIDAFTPQDLAALTEDPR